MSGIVVYSLDSGQDERLTDFGLTPVWLKHTVDGCYFRAKASSTD